MSWLNDIGSWIGHANPTVVIPAIGTGVAFLYHTIRGDKKAAATDRKALVNSVIDNLGHELLDKYGSEQDVTTFVKQARAYIDKNAWPALEKRGIPRNAVTEQWFHEGLERGTAALTKQVLVLRKKVA